VRLQLYSLLGRADAARVRAHLLALFVMSSEPMRARGASAPPSAAPSDPDPNSLRHVLASNLPRSFADVFPVLDVARTLSADDLKADVIAGLTVAVMVVPQGMAYAALASLRPEIGLYSCIVPILTYAVLGTSRQLAVGPVAMVALLTTAGLSPLQDPLEDPERYRQLASALAFLVGVIQAGMGFLKLEFVAQFLPHPVLSGFTSAAAIVIGSSQLKDVFGLKLERSERLHEILESFFEKIGGAHGLTMAVAFTSIFALLAARHLKRRFASLRRVPEALILVTFWILVSHYADFEDKGVKVIGKVPSGFPAPTGVALGDVGDLLGPAVTISLVGFLESFAVAKTIAEKEGYRMSARRELVGLGLANVAGAFFKCMPVTGGFSRSAVNYQAGARSTLSSVVTALSLIVVVLALTPLFTDLPKPILSAIIIVAVSTLVDLHEFAHLWRTDKRDFVLVACAFACTLFWGLLEGILVSAGLAAAMLVQRVASPHAAVLVRVNDADDPKGPVFRNRERFPDGARVPGVLIYRQDAPLFYANADAFKDAVRSLAEIEEARVVLLHGGAMPHVDSTGVAALEQLRRWLASRNKRLAMCEFNGPTRDALERAGLTYRADESAKEGGGFAEEDDSRAEDELERPDSRDPATAAAPMYLALADAVRSAETTAARLAADEVCVGFDDDTHDQAARALVGGGGGDSVARRASRDSVGSAGSGGAYDDLEEGGKTAVSVPDY